MSANAGTRLSDILHGFDLCWRGFDAEDGRLARNRVQWILLDKARRRCDEVVAQVLPARMKLREVLDVHSRKPLIEDWDLVTVRPAGDEDGFEAAVLLGMDIGISRVMTDIDRRRGTQNLDEYPLQAAVEDAIRMDMACSLEAAVSVLGESKSGRDGVRRR